MKHSVVSSFNTITKVVAGGQTGADRAALDWAIFRDIPHGGWCPKGRKAEDGTIPARYELQETKTANYLERTERNVIESDGTIIFTMSAPLAGGSKRTADFATKHGKPWLHLYPGSSYEPERVLLDFINEHKIAVVNVAGSRGSKEPEVAAWVKRVLEAAFFSVPSSPVLCGPGEGQNAETYEPDLGWMGALADESEDLLVLTNHSLPHI